MSRPLASANADFGSYERPDWLEAISAVAMVVALAVYLPILLNRTIDHGFGDVQVFFRAGWAVWTGYPLYEVTDLHGWSYHYPPIFALMMGPFADPLPGFPRPSWALPFDVSVGIFYAISIAAMLLSAHVWAKAIEDHAGVRFSGRRSGWWTLRVGPLLLLAPYFGASFSRGQPTTILILLASLFLKYAADRRPALASPALALAIAIKIFPAALLIIPLLRRELRVLALTALWCAVFLFVIPALVLGVQPTIELYRTLWIDRLSGIAEGDLANRVEVEISPWSEDMVAFGSMLARTFAAPLAEMPYRLPAWAQALQLGIRSRRGRARRRARPRPFLELVRQATGASLCDPGRRRHPARRAAGGPARGAAALLGPGSAALSHPDRRALASTRRARRLRRVDHLVRAGLPRLYRHRLCVLGAAAQSRTDDADHARPAGRRLRRACPPAAGRASGKGSARLRERLACFRRCRRTAGPAPGDSGWRKRRAARCRCGCIA